MELAHGQMIHGFAVRCIQPLAELGATLYRMEYEQNGADLIWLDRDDSNKTFSITFKTIPEDDTGVFHILEHSVLCGSRKYPVKEPFVELLKSSLQTFLNAMTYPDKTMYPVCSRNDQDFLNLMDVYLDAVFHPLSVTDPHAFLQEGWHYELDTPEGELRRNGVVYNEMKGAYSDADTVVMYEINRLLFPDNCYGFESGGHPDSIPDLTYERYLSSYARFYHPSNARIFLDGQVNLDAVLEKLDEYLKEYDRLEIDAEIPLQSPKAPEKYCGEYEIGTDESAQDKTILAAGWVAGRFDQREQILACSALARLLCSSNESPLTKAILDQGLAQDVTLTLTNEILQPYLLMTVRNTDSQQEDQVWKTISDVLTGLADSGLDHNRLHAILNRMEFTRREHDIPGYPKGLIYAMETMQSWLYGGDPALMLSTAQAFETLHRWVDEGKFEQLLRSVFVDNPHHASLCLLPSPTLGEKRHARQIQQLKEIRSGWSDEVAVQVMDQYHTLRERQEQPDSPQQLATLPVLSLEDIPEQMPEQHTCVQTLHGCTLLHQPVSTDGIIYLNLYFSLDDLPLQTLKLLPLLGETLAQVATMHFDPLTLRSELEGKLGSLRVRSEIFSPIGQQQSCNPCLIVSTAVLESQKQEVPALLEEILLHSRFDDFSSVENLLCQSRISLEQRITAYGNAYAVLHASASLSARNRVNEALQGLEQLRFLQQAESDFDENGTALCRSLSDLCRQIFVRNRMTISLTGERDDAWLEQILSCFPSQPVPPPCVYTPSVPMAEGFLIPAGIGYAACCGSLLPLGSNSTGAARVAANLLALDYLWNTVRVRGGAYGVSMRVQEDGLVRFSSFRDPQCSSSLEAFSKAGEALRAFCDGDSPLDAYIISTVGELEPLLSPRSQGDVAGRNYFNGIDPDYLQRVRSEVLHTTREDLRRFSRQLDLICQDFRICVIGGQNVLDGCRDLLEHIEPLHA